MKEMTQYFPALSHCTYLNTAANGMVAEPVVQWRRAHDLQLMNEPGTFRDYQQQHLNDVREILASFIHASASEIALVPNFSLGFNMLLEALPEGQEVLLLKKDYPSINWPVETRDFNVCYAAIDENLEDNISAAIKKHKPDIFVFSIVQWLNGIKINLDFLRNLKMDHPELLIIADGTQFLGTESFQFSSSGIDVLIASAYKWLNAGYGNGFMVISEEARKKIFPETIGFNSAETFASKATDTLFMRHFEPGHLDTLNFGSLAQAILFIKNLGEKNVYSHLAALSSKAKNKFAELGLLSSDTLGRDVHSSIFNLKGNVETFERLKQHNVFVSQRGGGIRVSFHYYNTDDDLEQVIRAWNS